MTRSLRISGKKKVINEIKDNFLNINTSTEHNETEQLKWFGHVHGMRTESLPKHLCGFHHIKETRELPEELPSGDSGINGRKSCSMVYIILTRAHTKNLKTLVVIKSKT